MFGAKLKELRKRLKLTQAQVAECLGLKQDTISKIENNIRTLTSFEIFKLSKKYDIPIGFFFGEKSLEEFIEIQFKAWESLNSNDQQKVPILKKIANRYYDIEDVLNLKNENILRRYSVETDEPSEIREIALEERRILGFDETEPINNLDEALSSYGIKILKPILEFSINGMFLSLGNNRFLIVINNDNSPAMRNFALAHEYGHYLFHRNDNFNIVTKDLDEPGSLVDSEKTANIFAAEFLMPEKTLKDFKVSDENITLYLHTYKVSRDAFIYRLDNMGIVAEKEKRYYLKDYRPIEALKKLELFNEEVQWYGRRNIIRRQSEENRQRRKQLNPKEILSASYRAKVLTAYEKGLISYKKICDYLFIGESELKKTIRQKEEFYDFQE